jgi:Cu(I)/Ag(I) efflux system membrane protein CusA/SilA
MGRSPQVIEDQVTYPLVSNLQGIPKIKNIRASSMFGMSFVYIILKTMSILIGRELVF